MKKPKQTGGKRTGQKQTEIRVRDISNVNGSVQLAGGDIITEQTTPGLSAEDVGALFGRIYTAIDSRANTPAGNREDLKNDVQEIQSAVTAAAQKKENVDEGFLLRRFRNIARMAPDLLDVVVATLANPLAGLGVAAMKLAAKAKEETS
jgi:hypothetical protein